MTKDPDGRNGY
jgi:hypothetical protein